MIDNNALNTCPDGGHCLNDDVLERATEIEQLARELAQRLVNSCVVQSHDGPVVCLQCNTTNIFTRAKLLPFAHTDNCIITRARRAGLLPE